MAGTPWISYWILPFFAGIVWLAELLAMLIWWVVQGEPIYPSFNPGQTIAYISDVGAYHLKPLFITMSTVTVVTFDISFILERWLRHTGRLIHNTSLFQKVLAVISIIASIAGAAGLILLSIFDTYHHPHLHDGFLVLFLGGYIVSAIFICWEYQRLGIHFRQHRILRISFWMKLAFIVVEIALAIAFGTLKDKSNANPAAVIEWVIAFIFTFYVWSFGVDFIPALQSRQARYADTTDMAERGRVFPDRHKAPAPAQAGEGYYGNNGVNGYDNGASGYPNGQPMAYRPPEPAQPSANF